MDKYLQGNQSALLATGPMFQTSKTFLEVESSCKILFMTHENVGILGIVGRDFARNIFYLSLLVVLWQKLFLPDN